MELNSDITLRGESWRLINEKMKPTYFETLYEAFRLSLAIGILYDERINDNILKELDGANQTEANIPRTKFNQNSGEMSYFFKTAILTTDTEKLNEKDRLYLAFSEDIKEDELENDERELMMDGISKEALEFKKANFLKEFANYGAKRIVECLSDNPFETVENLKEFISDSYRGLTPELIEKQRNEELLDE